MLQVDNRAAARPPEQEQRAQRRNPKCGSSLCTLPLDELSWPWKLDYALGVSSTHHGPHLTQAPVLPQWVVRLGRRVKPWHVDIQHRQYIRFHLDVWNVMVVRSWSLVLV